MQWIIAVAPRLRARRRFFLLSLATCSLLVLAWAQDPAASTPDEDPASEALEIALDTDDTALEARRAGEAVWRYPLPRTGGSPTAPLRREDDVVIAQGAYLLTLDAASGEVRTRAALPGPARALRAGQDGLEVEVAYASDESETVPVTDGAPAAPIRFGADAEVFGALRASAAAANDPVAAWEQDPTQPWLALEAARAAEDPETREARILEAARAAAALPFFESAALAGVLAREGSTEAAADAMEAALEDFAARSYDPRLLSDPELREAYGFAAFGAAVEEGEVAAARTLAPFAWRLAAEEAPSTITELEGFARLLRDHGERETAAVWRERARAFERSGVSSWVDRAALALGRFGYAGVAALAAGFVLAWATLLAKVWRAQTLARRQRRERGQRTPLLGRAWVPRHAGTPEKLALLLVAILIGLAAVLAGWADRGEQVGPALRSGTLASTPAVRAAEALPDTPHAAFVRGTSLAVRGEREAALRALEGAGEVAAALVNRGVLEGNDGLLADALELDPRDPVARYHLDRSENPSPFHAAYREDQALLAVPGPHSLVLAAAGDWRQALGRFFTAPWRALPEARPQGVPAVGWWLALIAYAALLVALAVNLLVPRPRVSKRAPRTLAYHPLALLVPGSGHLDELWGLLLLVPASLLAGDLVARWLGGAGSLGLSVRLEAWILVGLWLINAAGFAVELASYRHRMRQLREEKPELARSYGLALGPPERERDG